MNYTSPTKNTSRKECEPLMAVRARVSLSQRHLNGPHRSRSHRRLATLLLPWVALLAVWGSASPAWAHGSGETTEGYLLVQQALGHLAHDTSSPGVALAMEKVGDALKTKDQVGVDVAVLRQARADLEGGKVAQGRTQLTESISEALAQLPPATGEETGTTKVPSALAARAALSGGDWMLLLVSVLLMGLGSGLAWRFRPRDSLRHLRAQLGAEADPVAVQTGPEGS